MKLPVIYGGLFIFLIGAYTFAKFMMPEAVVMHNVIAAPAVIVLILMIWASYSLFRSFFTCSCHEVDDLK